MPAAKRSRESEPDGNTATGGILLQDCTDEQLVAELTRRRQAQVGPGRGAHRKHATTELCPPPDLHGRTCHVFRLSFVPSAFVGCDQVTLTVSEGCYVVARCQMEGQSSRYGTRLRTKRRKKSWTRSMSTVSCSAAVPSARSAHVERTGMGGL